MLRLREENEVRIKPPKVEDITLKGYVVERAPEVFELRILLLTEDGREERVKLPEQEYASFELADIALGFELDAQVKRMNEKGYWVKR